jgi:hypothetical protein
MNALLYLVLCLTVPLLWGLAAARIYRAWEERQARKKPVEAPPPRAENVPEASDMYHI